MGAMYMMRSGFFQKQWYHPSVSRIVSILNGTFRDPCSKI